MNCVTHTRGNWVKGYEYLCENNTSGKHNQLLCAEPTQNVYTSINRMRGLNVVDYLLHFMRAEFTFHLIFTLRNYLLGRKFGERRGNFLKVF